jgi:hypothetical protein
MAQATVAASSSGFDTRLNCVLSNSGPEHFLDDRDDGTFEGHLRQLGRATGALREGFWADLKAQNLIEPNVPVPA